MFLLQKAAGTEAARLRNAIKDRFDTRLREVKAIHRENPFDGLHHLEAMKPHFLGYPGLNEVGRLTATWRRALPKPPLGKRQGQTDLLKRLDLTTDAVRGTWAKDDGHIVSPVAPYARVQLSAAPRVMQFALRYEF